ncbi:hypothetical protein CathTA2_3104 [Caldalkalibacillus thermarum TA2.A1]|uniref:Uncharacterized protein n=1 Tax=Caldalkalibacillus thermarum (strain TA2.A1) TaxID=986075 RepID=F5LB19_CALTT|nr:hypothetical protein [Caldalkalibacillus thermarum]EGL81558.1 hypothetical protein CathTA2_3104 [Caldalkalibacillus thermarum TA2.A1]QZT33849.1 hypothetical protein HUR95_16860 [Caldalkalibacillus thermarum TA2.A1]
MKQLEDGTWIIITTAIFQRKSEVYALQVQFPEEYAEGFIPRALALVDHIEWFNLPPTEVSHF